ncbi:hypothetical protein [Streptococcus dentiloxodontae]
MIFDYKLLSAQVTDLGNGRVQLRFKATIDASIYGYRKVWKKSFGPIFEKRDGKMATSLSG